MVGGCLGRDVASESEREDQSELTFIARNQRPALGLEVGWDDVTEAVGQDVVCFVVDVLPAVGTGLEDRERFRGEESGSGGHKAEPGSARWFCRRREVQRGQEATFSPIQPRCCAGWASANCESLGSAPGRGRQPTNIQTNGDPSKCRKGKTLGYGLRIWEWGGQFSPGGQGGQPKG